MDLHKSDIRPLELSADAMRRLVDDALGRVIDHVTSLPDQPSHDLDGVAEVARSLREPLPETGTAHPELLDLLFERCVPKSYNTAGPGYLAYIPGGGLFHSAAADLIADAVNRYVGVWIAAPALVQLEANVIRWFCELVGYPADAGGILTTGGSLATFSAVVAARERHLGERFHDGRIYVSNQVHHSLQKAAKLAGFPADAIRTVEVDRRQRMDVEGLDAAVREDRAADRRPFLVVASAGTVNTGAVDDLAVVARVAREHGLWFHADAAYGGFFMLTERGRRVMTGIAEADSITLDPHKGLFLPYGTGSLLVRDRAALRQAHQLEADYLPEMRSDPDFVDFCQMSPELSRDFRGLRVWLPMKMAGAAAFRDALDEKLDLTAWATEQLRQVREIEIVAEPQLSIVAFRLVLPDLPRDAANAANRTFLDRINARKRVYLTGTALNGAFVLRICVLSFRTHLEHMQAAIDDIKAAAAEVLAGLPGSVKST